LIAGLSACCWLAGVLACWREGLEKKYMQRYAQFTPFICIHSPASEHNLWVARGSEWFGQCDERKTTPQYDTPGISCSSLLTLLSMTSMPVSVSMVLGPFRHHFLSNIERSSIGWLVCLLSELRNGLVEASRQEKGTWSTASVMLQEAQATRAATQPTSATGSSIW
jgi:hypothetical protein